MTRHNIIALYLALSAANGIVPVGIAALFSVPIVGLFIIWAFAATVTFTLICLACTKHADATTNPTAKARRLRSEIESAYY